MTTSRAASRLLLLWALACGVASVGACGDDEPRVPRGSTGAPPAVPVPPATPAAPAPPQPPLPRAADLRLPPADVRVLLSGAEIGTLKPCGCSAPQKGGLERRAAFWERAREGAGAAAAVSLGDAIYARDDPRQNALKLELFAAALVSMGYDGVLTGVAELVQGPQPVAAPSECPRPPLNVKLRPGGPAAACGSVDPVLRFERGGLRVRAVSVLDPTARESLEQMNISEAVLPPQAALAALEKEPGLLIVAAHVYREDLAHVVQAVAGKADVVVVVDVPGNTAYARPVALARPDKPLLVRFEGKGQEVGVLDLVRDGSAWKAAYRAVELDPSLEEAPSPARDEIASFFDVYRRRVREERLLEEFPSFRDDGLTFVGSDACAECHPAIHASWKTTAHAHAMPTLEKKDYHWDPQCVRCHVVGWERADRDDVWTRRASGFQTPEATPALGNVGCEACHGPGSAHVAEPYRKDLWKPYGTPGARNWVDVGRAGCQRCHDADNSPTFFERHDAHYRPRVDHRDVPAERRTTAK